VPPGSPDDWLGHDTRLTGEKAPQADDWIFPGIATIATWGEQAWELLSEAPPHQPGQFGQGGQFGHSGPSLTHYAVTWFPDASVAGQNATLGFVRQEIGVACPLWKDECDMVGLTTNVRSVLFHTLAMLPGSSEAFPQELWDIRFGVNYKHTFDNGWTAGGNVTFGSASDRPFNSVNELTASVMAFLRIPVGEHNAWLFSLMYSPTGELSFPIPGVAFYWQPSDTFNATLGIPFKVMWRPLDGLTLEASYMPLTNVRARATYHIWGGISVYAGYDNTNEAYLLAGRSDTNNRFFIYDQRVTGGVKLEFGRHVCLDLSSGYAFDRLFFQGHSISDQGPRIDVGDTPFGSLLFEVRY
jgi:hypothetical protein